jgi:hypothetical protein
MPVVFENLELPGGGTPPCVVDITLVGAGGRPVAGTQISTGLTIVSTRHVIPNADGIWTITLPGNDDISPDNTAWLINRICGCNEYETFISVPATGGPYEASELETDPLSSIAPSALAEHEADIHLHGGGDELFNVELGINLGPITSVSYVDMAGLTATIVVPDRPFVLEANLPLIVEGDPVTGFGEFRIVAGSGPTQIVVDRAYGHVTNLQRHLLFQARVPAATYTPVVGSNTAFRVQWRSSAVTNAVSTFLNFGGVFDVCQFRGFTA